MGTYLSVDGGGSKLRALLFDDAYRCLGEGLTGGVNTTQTTLENARQNIDSCLDQVFARGVPARIDVAYVVFVGPVRLLYEALERRTEVARIAPLTEPVAGLLAGALREEGILALAGTGSDVFYVHAEENRRSTVGAWGPILGDQGSGTWIGQRALRCAVAHVEGWGEPTRLYDDIAEAWALERPWDLVSRVHDAVAPFRQVASACPIVGRAAHAGDAVALRILREAGEIMATQAKCLIRRQSIEQARDIVCCGGAWKAHPSMFDAFAAAMRGAYPDIRVDKPWFEHVLAGPARRARESGMGAAEGKAMLAERFPGYVIDW